MTTLVVVPVLRRPHRVQPLLESLESSTPEPHRVLFVCTEGDTDQIAAVRESGFDWFTIPHAPGDYARKINEAYYMTDHPELFTGADDLRFHPGWLSAALDLMSETVGVVGTNDLGNRRVMLGSHSTHSLVARWYVEEHGTADEPDKVLHEGYEHEFVDDELVGCAMRRGAWAFAPDSVVEHLHPQWGKAPTDDLYDRQTARMLASRALFRQRRRMWT